MTSPSLADFDAMWDYADPARTDARFREVLAMARESGDRDYLLQLLTQIARAQGLQGRFDDANATLGEVEREIAARASPVVTARYFLERGRVLNSSGDPQKARPLFLQAMDTALGAQLGNFAVDAAHMVAIVEPDPVDQLTWNLRAIALTEQFPETRRWLASLYNNTGEACFRLGQYEQALEWFQKIIEIRQQDRKPLDFFNHTDVARCLRLLGRVDEAIAQLDLATPQHNGYVQEQVAECLLAKHRPEDARRHFAAAYAVLSNDDWLLAHEPERLARLREMSKPSL
ncbi:MAG: tetratricopeptide repeat protein [Tepidisphaeraceae bacterium]